MAGLEDREHRSISEEIFERPVLEIKRRTWLQMEGKETVAAAAREMVSKRIGSVLVTRDSILVGILTERDLLNRMVESPFDPGATALQDLMTREVHALRPHDTVAVAIHRMSQGRHRHLPLVDDRQRPVGLVSVRDIVDYLAVLFPHKILTVPPDPGKIPPTREGG